MNKTKVNQKEIVLFEHSTVHLRMYNFFVLMRKTRFVLWFNLGLQMAFSLQLKMSVVLADVA